MRAVSKVLSLAVLAAVLAACGGGHPHGIPSRFDDVDPYRWRQNAPDTYPVHGIDVSRWQGPIDWHRVAGADVAFAFIPPLGANNHIEWHVFLLRKWDTDEHGRTRTNLRNL